MTDRLALKFLLGKLDLRSVKLAADNEFAVA